MQAAELGDVSATGLFPPWPSSPTRPPSSSAACLMMSPMRCVCACVVGATGAAPGPCMHRAVAASSRTCPSGMRRVVPAPPSPPRPHGPPFRLPTHLAVQCNRVQACPAPV